jgi:hypothetical protein
MKFASHAPGLYTWCEDPETRLHFESSLTLAAEDCDGAVRVIGRSNSRWRAQHKHDTYHQADACAQRLDWTLAAIDLYVRPHDPPAALDLLVQFFEADEDLGQDDLEQIAGAFERATELFWKVAKACPAEPREAALSRVLARDNSGDLSGLERRR